MAKYLRTGVQFPPPPPNNDLKRFKKYKNLQAIRLGGFFIVRQNAASFKRRIVQ